MRLERLRINQRDDDRGASGAKQLNGMSQYIANVTSLESADRGFEFAIEKLGGKFNHQSYDGDQQKLQAQVQQFATLGINGVTSYIVADSIVPRYAKILSDKKVAYVNFANRIPWFTPAEEQFNGYYVSHCNGSFGEEGARCLQAALRAREGRRRRHHPRRRQGRRIRQRSDVRRHAGAQGVPQRQRRCPHLHGLGPGDGRSQRCFPRTRTSSSSSR